MISRLVLPDLLETGPVNGQIMAIRDGPVNFYIVRGSGGFICVDAGWRAGAVERGFAELNVALRDIAAVLLTHDHWDHARCRGMYPNAQIFGGMATKRRSWPMKLAAAARSPMLIKDGQIVTTAGLAVRAIATPGHSPDSVSYVIDDRFLFTGDALRLRRSKAVTFPAIFNHYRKTARRSLHKLAQLRGLELLLTAHSGTAHDVDAALRDWRTPADGIAAGQGEWS